MKLIPALTSFKRTLKRKLFVYMLLLTALLLLTLFTGLFLMGRFHSTKTETSTMLELQMDAFEKDISTYYDHLAAAGVQLSEHLSAILDIYLFEHGLTVADLTDNADHLEAVQAAMLEPLCQRLLREDCSGIFVMLDATVNSTLDDADCSKAGLYLQINGYDPVAENLLLCRGPAELAKENGIMPHRKWHLEFRTDRFPEFDTLMSLSDLPAYEGYYVTEPCPLPGTSEQVMLLVVPISGWDGSFYGLCGMEISASYFMSYHAQPTPISHLTCLLTPDGSTLQADAGLSCGTEDGYYRAPTGSLTVSNSGRLRTFTGDAMEYIGVTREITLTPNNEPYRLTVLSPKADYDRTVRKAVLQDAALWLLILFSAVNCCLFFSRRFLTPILRALEQVKSGERSHSDIPEIDDLFAFLAEQDRQHDATLRALEAEKQQAQAAYETARAEIARLSYKMKQEVNPEEYRFFRNGLQELTPTERKIFQLYFEGKSAKEILELLQIKENTLKFHNKGIYSKLGVSSRKQLLQFAALMKQEDPE